MKPFKPVIRLCLGLVALACMATSCNGQNKSDEPEVVLETTLGEIRVRLYNDTPLHRDRFLQNVRNGLYDGKTWHRIIRNFMIQTGEQPARIDANGDTLLQLCTRGLQLRTSKGGFYQYGKNPNQAYPIM